MRVVLILIALGAVLAPLLAPAPSRAADLSGHVSIEIPDTVSGPAPVVIFLSGCGGVRQVQTNYAQAALSAGWAPVIVDSHAARGIGALGARLTVCTGLRMRGAARASDIFAVIETVRADPRLDAGRIVLTGWSHGGWTILDALALARSEGDDRLSGVEAAYLLYPYCGVLSLADTAPIGEAVDVTMVLAGRDRVVSAEACRALAAARRAQGAAITVIEEPELTHAFDAPDQPAFDPRNRYDAAGAARAEARFIDVLNRAQG